LWPSCASDLAQGLTPGHPRPSNSQSGSRESASARYPQLRKIDQNCRPRPGLAGPAERAGRTWDTSSMASESVELIRSVHPDPDTDLVALFNDDSASGKLMQTIAPPARPGLRGGQTLSGGGARDSSGTRWSSGWLA